MTSGPFHVCHMSARQSIRAVRDAKARGVTNVTCEVAPHHFVMTDEALETPIRYDTNVKMNPPLRDAADRDDRSGAGSFARDGGQRHGAARRRGDQDRQHHAL